MAIDYTLPSPTNAIIGGFNVGSGLNQLAQNKINQQIAIENKALMDADIGNVMSNSNASAADFARLTVKYPQLNEQFKQSWELLSSEKQKNRIRQVSDVYAAIEAGNVDIAKKILEMQAAAAENSGDIQSARSARVLIDTIDINPNTAKTSIALRLASMMGPEKFTDTFTEIEKARRERELLPGQVQKQAADLGLTQAQTKQALAGVEKTNAETQKLILEMEASKAGGGPVDPAKRFDLEQKLRNEYSKETKNFMDVQEAYRRIEAAQDTAAGDLGLIFSYMKMLDPGSVVREGEFATAQNAAGVPDRVVNIYNNLLSGERLNPGQRKSFRAQAGSLFNASRKREQEVRSGLTRVVNSYGLKSDNVFLTESPATVPTTGGEPSYMKYATGAQ